MILIADSGSTKTDWCLLDKGDKNAKFFKTKGINPQVQTSDWINEMLHKEIPNPIQHIPISHVYFYGAGCSSKQNNKIVGDQLKQIFNAGRIHVNHDIMGAARALCGVEPGIACILGTGANSVYFDGKDLIKKSDALGYILGDEGSGAYIGKKLVADFLYGNMPDELMLYYKDELNLSKAKIFNKVYSQPNANRYLASFCGSLEQFRSNKYVEDLLENSFDEFFKLHVLIYEESKNVPIHFTGSIAFFYQDVLDKICHKYELQLGNFAQRPIQQLRDYHQNFSHE
ncbi:MAG: N-acetylglucosamine kinase [Chitinophagales bacterium]